LKVDSKGFCTKPWLRNAIITRFNMCNIVIIFFKFINIFPEVLSLGPKVVIYRYQPMKLVLLIKLIYDCKPKNTVVCTRFSFLICFRKTKFSVYCNILMWRKICVGTKFLNLINGLATFIASITGWLSQLNCS
jgi:hypothetical protein